jgi:hypothetical protein
MHCSIKVVLKRIIHPFKALILWYTGQGIGFGRNMRVQELPFLAGAGLMMLGLAACAQYPGGLAANNVPAALTPMTVQMLMGSTPTVLDAEFGKPALLRVDGTAQVWLYHSDVCGLDLILYPDAGGTPRVAAAVPDNGGDPSRCMASLQRGMTDAANTGGALERPASS